MPSKIENIHKSGLHALFGKKEYCLVTNEDYETFVGTTNGSTIRNLVRKRPGVKSHVKKISEGYNSIVGKNFQCGNLFVITAIENFPQLKCFGYMEYVWKVKIPEDAILRYSTTEKYPIFRIKEVYVDEPIHVLKPEMKKHIEKWVVRRGETIGKFKEQPERLCNIALEHNTSSAFVHINEPTDDMWETALKTDGRLIKHHPNPSNEQKLWAVKSKGQSIKDIENPTYEMCLIAMKSHGESLKIVKARNPEFMTDELVNTAIENHPSVVLCLMDPTYDQLHIALSLRGTLLEMIQNRYPDLYDKYTYDCDTIAVKSCGTTLKFCDKDSVDKELCINAVSTSKNALRIVKEKYPQYYDEDVIETALSHYGMCLSIVENPTHKMIMAAIDSDPDSIKYVEKHYFKICVYAVSNSGKAIRLVNKNDLKPYEYHALCALVVMNKPSNIEWIDEPDEKICLLCLSLEGVCISHIEDPTHEMKMVALKNSCRAIRYIEKPTKEMYLIAIRQHYTGIVTVLRKIYNEDIDVGESDITQFCQLAISLDKRSKKYIKGFFAEVEKLNEDENQTSRLVIDE